MSDIQKALAAATECEPSKRKGETITSPDYLKRLAAAVGELADADWGKLTAPAQDWYNAAVDAAEAKKDLPAFTDLEEPKATGRRGTTPAAEAIEKYEPALGDNVSITTKRGRVIVGTIAEMDKMGLVVDAAGKDVELDFDKIESIELDGGAATPAGPTVGDMVKVVTQRGKTIVGEVKELTDSDIVIVDAQGEIHDLVKDRVSSVTVLGTPPPAGTTASAAVAAKPPRAGSATNGGVSVTARMRELMCDNDAITKEAMSAALKKENLEFKPATLDLIFSDTSKIFALLRERKKLK